MVARRIGPRHRRAEWVGYFLRAAGVGVAETSFGSQLLSVFCDGGRQIDAAVHIERHRAAEVHRLHFAIDVREQVERILSIGSP